MKSKRSASQLSGAPRRSVDEDGVVRIELSQGARRFLGPRAALVALGAVIVLGVGLWFGVRPRSGVENGGGPGDGAREARLSSRGRAGHSTRGGVESGRSSRGADALARWGMPSGRGSSGDAEEAARGAGLAGEPGDDEGEGEAGEDELGFEAPDKASGERTGLAAFPPHGTKKIKEGLVVPDDFPLPPGYVRHYQATDKGQMLEAILMFHPDYQPVDAQGNPIALPADRVVPPDMMPEGLPGERLQVPEDAYGSQNEPEGPPGEGDTGDHEADPTP
ncbi:hypothetical protein [Chondromyces crocatus]|uniref:Uncharacterized protein n=1 Tax=Chondromyces crocatus TaxID=52 RepID=A0A0K1ES04_CHOCO|nr:hypothetical protein [Chondromyces crocatus]AKT43636.1 uncharacterized protein CMC5_078710 [Chondromyces crocatus]